jgi:hypothetical protein
LQQSECACEIAVLLEVSGTGEDIAFAGWFESHGTLGHPVGFEEPTGLLAHGVGLEEVMGSEGGQPARGGIGDLQDGPDAEGTVAEGERESVAAVVKCGMGDDAWVRQGTADRLAG